MASQHVSWFTTVDVSWLRSDTYATGQLNVAQVASQQVPVETSIEADATRSGK